MKTILNVVLEVEIENDNIDLKEKDFEDNLQIDVSIDKINNIEVSNSKILYTVIKDYC